MLNLHSRLPPWPLAEESDVTSYFQASKTFESDSKYIGSRYGVSGLNAIPSDFPPSNSYSRTRARLQSTTRKQDQPKLLSNFSINNVSPLCFSLQSTRKHNIISTHTPRHLVPVGGTFKAPGDLLLPEAGRVAGLDEIAKSFLGLSSEERRSIIKKATVFLSELCVEMVVCL
ncbi:hypothetical protein VP01_145g7 [Puccinia sorghi]|uniref:Uncharacterized protein n=1 Tax=Puccinia sorghi TaxID=27349 RepID=A0A0L6VK15_9BASI|nr:hypothetical protein VP01_145g7 [Puccinia sorghi]